MSLAVFNSAAFLTDAQLAVAAGATIEVRRESDSGLAAIYSDRAGTVGITNPSAFADASGRFTFYAAGLAGGYSIEVTSGAESFTLNNVAVGLAAELDASAYGGSLMAAADAAAALTTLGAQAAATAAKLNVEDQALTGGVIVTSKSLGTIATGTVTPDPGDRPMQHYTNGGAHTLAPSTNKGSLLVDITNDASAGAITTSGFTLVTGDAFTTTNAHKFRCNISIGEGGSVLQVLALQ